MKIVLAPDSFKGSLSAADVCIAMEKGVRNVCPQAEVISLPMADGGEGTVESLTASTQGQIRRVCVKGPLGESIEAFYGLSGNQEIAVIEMAAASGLPLVPEDKRSPFNTTTYGTGELILDALSQGVRQIIIGIGGSATTDCGCGMAQALGVQFFQGSHLMDEPVTGHLMGQIDDLTVDCLDCRIEKTEITVACDVKNPLLGPAGAVAVYGPQKGAGPEELPVLEANLMHAIDIIESSTQKKVRDLAGAGAAGGLGAGLVAFLDAELRSGVELILEACRFSRQIEGADLILTGEGKVDNQTGFGKTIAGIMAKAQSQHIPGAIVAGTIDVNEADLKSMGIVKARALCEGDVTVDYAMTHAASLIEERTASLLAEIEGDF